MQKNRDRLCLTNDLFQLEINAQEGHRLSAGWSKYVFVLGGYIFFEKFFLGNANNNFYSTCHLLEELLFKEGHEFDRVLVITFSFSFFT